MALYENLVILCPNCHTEFDKLSVFGADEKKGWKQAKKVVSTGK